MQQKDQTIRVRIPRRLVEQLQQLAKPVEDPLSATICRLLTMGLAEETRRRRSASRRKHQFIADSEA